MSDSVPLAPSVAPMPANSCCVKAATLPKTRGKNQQKIYPHILSYVDENPIKSTCFSLGPLLAFHLSKAPMAH